MNTLGQCLKQLRTRKDRTGEQAAAAIHVTARTYWRYESGHHIPDDATVRRLAQALDGDVGQLLWLARTDRDHRASAVQSLSHPTPAEDDGSDARTLAALEGAAEDDMKRRGFIGLTGAGIVTPETRWLLDPDPRERVSTETVDTLRTATTQLEAVADRVPLSVGLPPLKSHLNGMATLLRAGQYEPRARNALFVAASEAARTVGCLHYAAGDRATARAHLRTAVSLAHAGGDPVLVAYTLTQLSWPEPESGPALVRIAQRGAAGRLTPGHTAWIHARLANVHVLHRHVDAALRELDKAQEGAPTAEEPDYFRWCTPTVVGGMLGRVYHAAGRHAQAQALLQPALEGASTPRDRAGFGESLARVQIDAGEHDAAIGTIGSVLDIAQNVQAPLAVKGLDDVMARLPDSHDTRALRERRASIA